jgi:hypothetical protein
VPRAYRFQSSGAANTQLLHLLHWFISSKQTEFTQPYLHNSSMPARLAPYTTRRRPARRSQTPREIVVPASPSRCGVAVLGSIYHDITGHSIIIVASRRFTGRNDNIRSPAIRTPNRATQRVGLDISWRDGPFSSLRLALSQTRLSAQCSLLCLAADSKDEEDDMPSRPGEAVFLYLNQVEPSSGPPVSLLRVCAIFDN